MPYANHDPDRDGCTPHEVTPALPVDDPDPLPPLPKPSPPPRLTPAQSATLAHLLRYGPRTQDGLREALHLPQATLSLVLVRLAEWGLVEAEGKQPRTWSAV